MRSRLSPTTKNSPGSPTGSHIVDGWESTEAEALRKLVIEQGMTLAAAALLLRKPIKEAKAQWIKLQHSTGSTSSTAGSARGNQYGKRSRQLAAGSIAEDESDDRRNDRQSPPGRDVESSEGLLTHRRRLDGAFSRNAVDVALRLATAGNGVDESEPTKGNLPASRKNEAQFMQMCDHAVGSTPFTASDDVLLVGLVAAYGQRWTTIASVMSAQQPGNFTAARLRSRWRSVLEPFVLRNQFADTAACNAAIHRELHGSGKRSAAVSQFGVVQRRRPQQPSSSRAGATMLGSQHHQSTTDPSGATPSTLAASIQSAMSTEVASVGQMAAVTASSKEEVDFDLEDFLKEAVVEGRLLSLLNGIGEGGSGDSREASLGGATQRASSSAPTVPIASASPPVAISSELGALESAEAVRQAEWREAEKRRARTPPPPAAGSRATSPRLQHELVHAKVNTSVLSSVSQTEGSGELQGDMATVAALGSSGAVASLSRSPCAAFFNAWANLEMTGYTVSNPTWNNVCESPRCAVKSCVPRMLLAWLPLPCFYMQHVASTRSSAAADLFSSDSDFNQGASSSSSLPKIKFEDAVLRSMASPGSNPFHGTTMARTTAVEPSDPAAAIRQELVEQPAAEEASSRCPHTAICRYLSSSLTSSSTVCSSKMAGVGSSWFSSAGLSLENLLMPAHDTWNLF